MRHIQFFTLLSTFLGVLSVFNVAHGQQKTTYPIIDVHMHAFPANWLGKPSVSFCQGHVTDYLPSSKPIGFKELLNCDEVISGATDSIIMNKSFEMMKKYNIVKAVASGSKMNEWKKANPDGIISSLMFLLSDKISADSVRTIIKRDSIKVIGELGPQYEGLPADARAYEPYWTLAEELQIPVGIHLATGPPGGFLMGFKGIRGAAGNPLNLENVLVKHSKLRVYVMHAGWPWIDNMLNLLYLHPQVYVDISYINYMLPKEEFDFYLKRLVGAGFGKRIMWGSDQMIWPESIKAAVESIKSAKFLTQSQKKDIFYNNAVRFFNLESDVK